MCKRCSLQQFYTKPNVYNKHINFKYGDLSQPHVILQKITCIRWYGLCSMNGSSPRNLFRLQSTTRLLSLPLCIELLLSFAFDQSNGRKGKGTSWWRQAESERQCIKMSHLPISDSVFDSSLSYVQKTNEVVCSQFYLLSDKMCNSMNILSPTAFSETVPKLVYTDLQPSSWI